VRKFFRLLA